MIVGIIGLGEVGSAIKKLCLKMHKVYARTRTIDELKGKNIDILHLCYPYNENFVEIAIEAIKELSPKLVIIDATVKPGTSRNIFNRTGVSIVHAPIIGKHPNLYEYLISMDKIVGPIDEKSYQLTEKHFGELGVNTVSYNSPEESEIAKLLCTTYYGWNIVFEKFVYQLCRTNNVAFNNVYAKTNEIYNKGYEKKLPQVRRPILSHYKGEIGGHCVLPNARIIKDWLHDDFSSFLLVQNDNLKDV
jgi:hypothetical protein